MATHGRQTGATQQGGSSVGATGQPLLRLSQIVRSALLDEAGERIGRVSDLVVHLDGASYPLVVGLEIGLGRRQVFVPIGQVATLGPSQVQLRGETVNLKRFERREGELLLRRDILHRKAILVETGRLVPVADIVLGCWGDAWRVAGIDSSHGVLLYRVLHRSSSRPLNPATLLDWSRIEPFVGHVPTAKLRLPLRSLRRLHPAQLADLVEAASPAEGTEIIAAVRGDPELEADVFEELNTEHQIEFLKGRTDAETAAVLATMSPDDAADLIGELPQGRRAAILAHLPMPRQAMVRSLLAYHPSTAGGLMSPDYIAIGQQSTVEQALARIAEVPHPVQAVYIVDDARCLIGALSLQTLLRAPRGAVLGARVEPIAVRLRADADFTDVALLMADYNLIEAPVVDEAGRLEGVISVDDVLEVLIPAAWRRRVEGGAG